LRGLSLDSAYIASVFDIMISQPQVVTDVILSAVAAVGQADGQPPH
jgi:hypothetical protein